MRRELRLRRVDLRMSQRELAAALDAWQSQVSAWESGAFVPNVATLLRWCHVLGMSARVERDR